MHTIAAFWGMVTRVKRGKARIANWLLTMGFIAATSSGWQSVFVRGGAGFNVERALPTFLNTSPQL